MKLLSLLSALIAFVAGLIAAWYWYDSTKKNLPPIWEETSKEDKVFHAMQWIESLADVSSKVADLNRRAALWTAASVLASAASALFAALPSD